LTCRIDRPDADFATRTGILTRAFGPHLETIPAMTRTHTDWVHDNVMNPAYFGILLTVPMVLEELGDRFDVYGVSPRFATDWRWFKSQCGRQREFNDHFRNEYHASLHNFLDYRTAPTTGNATANQTLEKAAWELICAVAELERATYAPHTGTSASRTVAV